MSEHVRHTPYYVSPLAQGPSWTHKPTSDNNSMKPITSGSKRLTILVLGDPNIGRSSLISTYLNGNSAVTEPTADNNNNKEKEHLETHEINVFECLSPLTNTSIELQGIQTTTKLKSVKVTITNPPSSVSHEQLTRQHLSEAAKPNSVIVAYSTNSPESLVSILEDWADYLDYYCPEVPVLLVGLQDDEVIASKNKEKLANDNDQLKSVISRIEHGEDKKSLTGHDQHLADIKNADTVQQAETDTATKIEATPHSELLKLGKEELSENTLINSKSINAETKVTTTPISSHHSTHKIDPKDAKSVAGMIGAVCHLSCSSLTGVNVDAVFDAAINAGMQGLRNRKKVNKMRLSSITTGPNASAKGHSKESSGCCCIV